MNELKPEGRQVLVQIFSGVLHAGAKLKDVSLCGFIGAYNDTERECGVEMLESLMSANLTDLTSLNLVDNKAFSKSSTFCEIACNLIARQTSLKILKVNRINNEESVTKFAQVIRQSSLEELEVSKSKAHSAASFVEAISEGDSLHTLKVLDITYSDLIS